MISVTKISLFHGGKNEELSYIVNISWSDAAFARWWLRPNLSSKGLRNKIQVKV